MLEASYRPPPSKPTLTMETAESIRLAITAQSWVVSIDMKDAFFHILVHKRAKVHALRLPSSGIPIPEHPLRPEIHPVDFQYGRQGAPSDIPQEGNSPTSILDDWVIWHQDPDVLKVQLSTILSMCQRL